MASEGSEEFILEIQSTEDITSADYLKAVVEKCLQSLNDGGEAPENVTAEPLIEIVTPEGMPEQDRHDSVVNYINFDEYMVNEVVICDSEDEGKPQGKKDSKRKGKQKVYIDRDKENEVIDSIRNDHMYHDIYQQREGEPGVASPQTYITIIEEPDGNIEIVETEAKSKRGRKKGSKNSVPRITKPRIRSKRPDEADDEFSDPLEQLPNKRANKSETVRKKKDRVPKEPKRPREPKPPKPPKPPRVPKPPKEPRPPRVPKPPKPPKQPRTPKEPKPKKEKIYNVCTGEKPLFEVVIKKPDVQLTVANGTNEDITDPTVQLAIKAMKENKENVQSPVKGNYSIFDPEGKVIMPFAPKRYNDSLPFWCDECEFKTGTRQRLKLHKLRRHGGEKQYQCCECSYSAHDAYSVRVHYGNMHCDTKKYKCDQCTFACNYQAGLRKHINKCHGDKKPYVCSKCGYEQYNITILKQHIQSVHLGIMPFSCNYCKKRFIDERRMQLHIKRLHYRQKRFRCAKCSFSAFTKCEVKKHLFSHHIQLLRLDCTQCDFSFKTRQDLVQHLKKVHNKTSSSTGTKTTSKQQPCQFCDFKSSHYKDLASHMKEFHGINKNVKCDECDFVTFDLVLLKRHIKELHNPDILKCKSCNFTTMSWASLKDHKKTHLDKVTFPCKLCNASFRYKMCLTKHEVMKHGRDLNEEPQDDKDTTYEKQWISYDKSTNDTTWEVISKGKTQTLTYVGVNPVTNIELDRLIADTVAGEEDDLDDNMMESCQEELPTYLCTTCDIVFQDKTVLDWHVNKHDLDDTFQLLASSKQNVVPQLSEEMSMTMERMHSTCSHCGFADEEAYLLVMHILLDHYNCEVSGMEGTILKKIPEEEKEDKDGEQEAVKPDEKVQQSVSVPMLSCGACRFMTSSRSLFMRHRKECPGEAQYVVPCEIVISDMNDSEEGQVVPVEIVESSDLIKSSVVKTRVVQRRERRIHREMSKHYRRRTKSNRHPKDYLSEDEDDPEKVRETFKCPECVFTCDRKRVMARHFINLHIDQAPKALRINKLKDTLSEKLGVKPRNEPDPLEKSVDSEDSEDVDDPDIEIEESPRSNSKVRSKTDTKRVDIKVENLDEENLVDLVGDPLADSYDATVIEKQEPNNLTDRNYPSERRRGESVSTDSECASPVKSSSPPRKTVKPESLVEKGLGNSSSPVKSKNRSPIQTKCQRDDKKMPEKNGEGTSSQGKIELFEKLSLKQISRFKETDGDKEERVATPDLPKSDKVTEEKTKTESSSSKDTPVRKSSRSNAGQNPKGLLSVKDIRLLIYGRPKSPDQLEYLPPFKVQKVSKNQSKTVVKSAKMKRVKKTSKTETERSNTKLKAKKVTSPEKTASRKDDAVKSKRKEAVSTVRTPCKDRENNTQQFKQVRSLPTQMTKHNLGFQLSLDEPVCERCEVKMSSWEALNMHTILAHGFSILLTCSYCCYTTSDKSQLREHIYRCFLLNS